jgi:hypothetical protein
MGDQEFKIIFTSKASFYFMAQDGMYGVYRKTGLRYWLAKLFNSQLDYIKKV